MYYEVPELLSPVVFWKCNGATVNALDLECSLSVTFLETKLLLRSICVCVCLSTRQVWYIN